MAGAGVCQLLVIEQEALLAPGLLQRRAEHEDGQHVEEQVPEAAMQEAIGQQLPRLEVAPRRERIEALLQWLQHERLEGLHAEQERLLQQEQDRIGDQQGLGDGWQSREHGSTGMERPPS